MKMKIKLTGVNDEKIVEELSFEEFVELNKNYELTIPGPTNFYSEPFNVNIKKTGQTSFSTIFPLLNPNFFRGVERIRIGELNEDPLLLATIKICFALTEEEKKEITSYLSISSISVLSEFNIFSQYVNHREAYTRASILCYLVKGNKAAVALEKKELFESNRFSVNFILDVYTKLEELNDILLAR